MSMATMGRVRVNQKQARDMIARRVDFQASALWGAWEYLHGGSVGMIYGVAAEKWRESVEGGQDRYVVYSYGTPIAWFDDLSGWIVPEEKYSRTTSRHQGVVRRSVPAKM
jgi:hypothetical protein